MLAVAACGGAGRSAQPAPSPAVDSGRVPRAERPFLLDPVASYPLKLDSTSDSILRQAHRAMLEGGRVEVAVRAARELLEVDPGSHPARVLAGQVALIESRPAAVIDEIRPVVDELPGYTAAAVLLARAHEGMGELAVAYGLYRGQRSFSPVAAERERLLAERAREIVGNRLEDALARGRLDVAEVTLTQLQEWAPLAVETFEATRAVAVARGDRQAELAAVTALSSARPDDLDLTLRRGELEVAVGDAGAGLQLLQGLAGRHPEDPRVAEQLARARFVWRLQLLPPDVQELAASPQLSRGEFAGLLYWLLPEVRFGRPGSARIASDILDHPRREEIARVVNLGLMQVDRTRHLFVPSEPVSRVEALAALLTTLSAEGGEEGRGGAGPPACLGRLAGGKPIASPHAQLCAAAARCRLIPDSADCLPRAPLSGAGAVEMIRRTLDLQ